MKTKETSHQIESSFNENLSDLMKELSDEEAGACVGGLVVQTPLLSAITNDILQVEIDAGLLGVDNIPGGSARIGRRL